MKTMVLKVNQTFKVYIKELKLNMLYKLKYSEFTTINEYCIKIKALELILNVFVYFTKYDHLKFNRMQLTNITISCSQAIVLLIGFLSLYTCRGCTV